MQKSDKTLPWVLAICRAMGLALSSLSANLHIAKKSIQESVAIQRTVFNKTVKSCFRGKSQGVCEQWMVKVEIQIQL